MKKLLILPLVILVLAPAEKVFPIFGIGGYYTTDPISVDGGTDGTAPISLVRAGFDGAQGGGLFLYIDAIPVVDLEASVETALSRYQFDFENALATLPTVDFAWLRVSTYLTVRKKLIGFELPILGGVRLNAGGGYNIHSSAPLADLDMVKTLLGGDLTSTFESDKLKDELIDYLKENKIDANGFHVQAGAQIKLLTFNLFVNYRITLAEDVVPGAKSFSSLWAGLAFGI